MVIGFGFLTLLFLTALFDFYSGFFKKPKTFGSVIGAIAVSIFGFYASNLIFVGWIVYFVEGGSKF